MNMTDLVTRLALERVAEEPAADVEIGAPFKQFSKPVRAKLRQAFGPRRLPFFVYYEHVKGKWADPDYDPGFNFDTEFRALRRIVFRSLVTDNAKNSFKALSADLYPLLRRIDRGTASPPIFKDIAAKYAELMEITAAERDVFIKGLKRGLGQWRFYRVVTKQEERLLVLKRDDPGAFRTIKQQKKILERVEAEIKSKIEEDGRLADDGREVKKTRRSGQIYWTARIPTPSGEPEVLIYYRDKEDGSIKFQPDEEFRASLKDRQRAERASLRVYPPDLEELRVVDNDEVEAARVSQEPHYVAITDDKAKQNGLTRIYNTVEIDGEKVVSEGRFKGLLVDSLVNAAGRQIEGVGYNYDHETNRTQKIQVKGETDGLPNLRVTREPYVTVDSKGRLFLKIPASRKYTQFRRAMDELAWVSTSVEKIPKQRNSAFRFNPKDFAAVREALGSFSMSAAAVKKITDHFKELAEFDMATEKENLKHYTTEAIGGFKPEIKMLTKQKQSIAWLEARGNNGVCALDTGIGKTLTAIGMMKKLMRDGVHTEDDNNGRFLYVCESSLVGNLPKEANKFCSDPADLLEKTDILTYTIFSKKRRADPEFGKSYVAIFFDEAHRFKNPTSGISRAAMSLDHPRKVLFTASPMTRNPMEVYSLAAVASNTDLNTPEGRRNTREFRKRFCEVVGGRVVGIKSDPVIQREFRVWVKRNLFYADKRDVEEVNLPAISTTAKAGTLDPRIETMYRETASEISDTMGALVVKYRDRDWDSPEAKRTDLEAFRIKFAKVLRRLSDLGNMPELFFDELSPDQQAQGPVRNLKADLSIGIIDEQIDKGTRALLHTDSPRFAEHMAPLLSSHYAMKTVAVCYASQIDLYRNGTKFKTYRPKEYTDSDGRLYQRGEWKTYVLSRIVSPSPAVVACILTSTYAVGQNLQAFDTTINLDRDTWNAEVMKQRRGRNWRQGQEQAVREYTLDAVYDEVADERDATLDQIRKWMQELEEELFDSVVIESQTEALGKEIREMDWMSSFYTGLNRKLMELTMSPNPARLGQAEAAGDA